MAENKVSEQRRTISFFFLIILGLVIGIFIRKVHVGLLLGLALGLLSAGLLGRRVKF